MDNKKLLVVAGIAGLLGAGFTWNYVAARERTLLDLAEPVRVVVATADVPRNAIVPDEAVRFAEIPRKFAQPGAIVNLEAVVGKRLAIGLRTGTQVSAHVSGDGQPSLAYLVEDAHRAVTVAVDDVTGVAGLIQPGDAVDVAAVFDVGAAGAGQPLARTLLQNITVLAVGTSVGARHVGDSLPAAADEDPESPEARPAGVTTVTLLVVPRQAQALVLAQHVGAITLLLRGAGDTRANEIVPTLARDVTGVEAAPRPPARPYWLESRDERFERPSMNRLLLSLILLLSSIHFATAQPTKLSVRLGVGGRQSRPGSRSAT